MTAGRRAIAALLLAVAAAPGCSSTVALTAAPVPKASWPSASPLVRVALGAIEGDRCFEEELRAYLAAPGGLQLARDGAADLTVSGALRRIEVHSNRGDKEVALLYFTAFVVTAPIAAVMYGVKDWQADAAAEARLEAVDAAGRTVWAKELTVSVAERQRTMPSHDALEAALTAAACQKIAATLLNSLAERIAAGRERR